MIAVSLIKPSQNQYHCILYLTQSDPLTILLLSVSRILISIAFIRADGFHADVNSQCYSIVRKLFLLHTFGTCAKWLSLLNAVSEHKSKPWFYRYLSKHACLV